MGGYISIKEAFAAIFIAILISTIMTTIWGIVYARVIDPGLSLKIKESTLAFMESMKAPQEKLDQTAADIDKQIGDSIKPGALIYGYAKSLVITSIFGFICAAIVRRAPKQQMM
jgi:Na+/H+-dicarboxylate symporter